MGQNSIISPLQELEVGPRRGPYLLVGEKEAKKTDFNVSAVRGYL